MIKYLILILFILQNAFSINEGLIAYYPFNGNVLDESGNQHHGTVYGAELTTDRFGKDNSAYKFDGTDYMNFDIDVDGWTERTMSLWIKTNQTKRMYIGGWGQDAVYGEQTIDINIEPGKIQTTLWDGVNYGSVITEPHAFLIDDQWHNIVVKYKLSDSLYIYLDGKKDVSIPVTKLGDPNSTFELGRTQWASSYPDKYYIGAIDDVVIFNRALSDEEINNLYLGYTEYPPYLIFPPHNSTDININTALIWSSVPSALFYDCQVSLSTDFSSVQTYSLSDTSYFIQNLRHATKYYWRVQAVTGKRQEMGWSDTSLFVTKVATSIKKKNIKYQIAKNTVVKYYDVHGKLLHSGMNVPNLSKGLYISEYQCNNILVRKRLLIK